MNKKILIALGVICMIVSIINFAYSYKKSGGCTNERECIKKDDDGNCTKYDRKPYTCNSGSHEMYIVRRLIFASTFFISGLLLMSEGILYVNKEEKNYNM